MTQQMTIAAETNQAEYLSTYQGCQLVASEARRYVSGSADLQNVAEVIITLGRIINNLREYGDAEAVRDMTTIRLAASELLSITAAHDGLRQSEIISDSAYYWAE